MNAKNTPKATDYYRKNGEFILDRDYATIQDITDPSDITQQFSQHPDCLRFYKDSPDLFTLQIRTHKPIREGKSAKPRRMIATARLTLDELRDMVRYAEAHEMVANIEARTAAFERIKNMPMPMTMNRGRTCLNCGRTIPEGAEYCSFECHSEDTRNR